MFKLLSILGHYSSFMYYVSDNLLWIIGVLAARYIILINIISKVLKKEYESKWKSRKNSFS